MGPILFIIFITDLEVGIKSKILKCAVDAKLIGTAGSVEEIQIIKRDLEHLWKWSEDWQMKFKNVDKCKIMHIGYNNAKEKFELGGRELVVVEEEKDLGVVVRDNLKGGSQCAIAAKNGIQILGMFRRTFECRSKNICLWSDLICNTVYLCGDRIL